MIVGSTLLHDGTGTTPYYSPSFPRGGESATFAIDATVIGGSPTLAVEVQHKNADDISWGSAGTFTGISATGVSTKDISQLKEEIRLSFTFTAGSAGDFVHFVVPQPAWRPY